MAQEFRPVGKRYKKIAGKKFRLPRKVKKWYKKRFCKVMGIDVKGVRISYNRLNIDEEWNNGNY